ncbi:MAG TPA: hypothetical protein VD995_03985 [Azospirillum sp.]|nr:hypothetical protein [Azospirillum sp.]
MLSFSKILVLIVVVVAVWFGWRWYQRIGEVGREKLRERDYGRRPQPRRGGSEPARGPGGAEDMEKCPECGAYVAPRSAVACGRPGCPYGR